MAGKPSSSPYGSPILFVRNRNGSMRMCIDYHYGGLVVLKSTLCPIQEIVFTGSLPETDEFSVESAPVESAPVESTPVVRLVRRRANN
ncbi:hypothetical protein MFLAVUS_007399 [Mucor flavus]|uniref:Uncharacterized protein n=1 Tax=Mucor flavus TaxID=439312 RepID=A0ABP9Z471_9FUNG